MVTTGRRRRIVAALEVLVAAVVVVTDLLLPTLLLLALAAVSLAVRRSPPSSLGFRRLDRPGRTALVVLGIVCAWSLVEIALVVPLLERITGNRQQLGIFADVEGDVGLFVTLVTVSWTLAAVGEEAAYRGYVLTRSTEATRPGRGGVLTAVLLSSALFALAHTEQGVVGVALTFLDALLFSWLRLRHASLWAAVLAHGFANSLGLTTFFLLGPVHGLW